MTVDILHKEGYGRGLLPHEYCKDPKHPKTDQSLVVTSNRALCALFIL